MSGLPFDAYSELKVRKASVAGAFYPSDPNVLRREVKSAIEHADVVSGESPKLLICPHAGYVFSGSIAAKGYAHLSSNITRVIIIGPSHYHSFSGFAYPEVGWYETPLGKVMIDEELVEKVKVHSEAKSITGIDVQEHCLEVQLPFLQVKLVNFKVLPLLTGRIDPEEFAKILFPIIDEKTVVIASSDLSHYHRQEIARNLDDSSISTILNNTKDSNIEGCGEIPIRTIMSLADLLKLKPILLDAKTSYETAPKHCSDDRVVGYASIMYLTAKNDESVLLPVKKKELLVFSEEHQIWMLKLARESLNAAVYGKPAPVPEQVPIMIKEARGCFITLTKNRNLRGCIGYIEPIKPLYQAIIENARNAALCDYRFSPISVEELKTVSLEISVLSKPEPLKYKNPDELLNKLRAGIDGVILSRGQKQSTFLPQVWEQLPQKIDFLQHLALKAGMVKDEWKTADVKIYNVEHFQEK